MIRRSRESVAAARLAGLLVLLPLALAMLAYAFDLVNRLLGPGSLVGPFFAAPGYPFAGHPGWRICAAPQCCSAPYTCWECSTTPVRVLERARALERIVGP